MGKSSHYAEPIKNTLKQTNKTKTRSASPGGGIPSQWRWPRDLLLFALVTAFCQDSVHNSGGHQQPRTVQRPGWSAWTKSKQITFPAVTDLQLTDRTACQRMTSGEHKDMSHPYLLLLISVRVKSLSGRYFSRSRDSRPMSQALFPPPLLKLVLNTTFFVIIERRSHASGDTSATLADKSASCRCDQVASFPAVSPSELIMAQVSPCLWGVRMVSTISAAYSGERWKSGSQLGCCCWRDCNYCHVTVGPVQVWVADLLIVWLKAHLELLGPKKPPTAKHSCDWGILLGTEIKQIHLTGECVKSVLSCC